MTEQGAPLEIQIHDLSGAVWKSRADRMMQAMFDEGVLPDRERLTGRETGIFALFGPANVVGMAIVYQPEDWENLWLDLLYVSPAHRRMGIGQELIAQVTQYARLRRMPAVELGTMLDNKKMMGLAYKCFFGGGTVYFKRELADG